MTAPLSAYPVMPPCDALGGFPAGYPDPEPGMTLRDAFAVAYRPPGADGISASWAAIVMGRQCPEWADDPLAVIAYFVEAEARLAYMHADAMLRAREEVPL